MAYVLQISLRLLKAELTKQIENGGSAVDQFTCMRPGYSIQILTQARVPETPGCSAIPLHNTPINIAYGDVHARLLHVGTIGSAH